MLAAQGRNLTDDCASAHFVDSTVRQYRSELSDHLLWKLEIRSVERGICPIARSTINERTVPIIMARCMAHAREGYISTSGLKSDVTLVLLDHDFLQDAQIAAIRP